VGGTETPPLGNAPPAQTGTETAMIKEEAGVRLGGYTGYTTIGVMHTEPRTQIGSESTTWLLGAKPTTASSLVVEGELVLRVLTVCGSEVVIPSFGHLPAFVHPILTQVGTAAGRH